MTNRDAYEPGQPIWSDKNTDSDELPVSPPAPSGDRVEAVARAICIARGRDPDDRPDLCDTRDDGRAEPDVYRPAWMDHRAAARAAIAALATLATSPADSLGPAVGSRMRIRGEVFEVTSPPISGTGLPPASMVGQPAAWRVSWGERNTPCHRVFDNEGDALRWAAQCVNDVPGGGKIEPLHFTDGLQYEAEKPTIDFSAAGRAKRQAPSAEAARIAELEEALRECVDDLARYRVFGPIERARALLARPAAAPASVPYRNPNDVMNDDPLRPAAAQEGKP